MVMHFIDLRLKKALISGLLLKKEVLDIGSGMSGGLFCIDFLYGSLT